MNAWTAISIGFVAIAGAALAQPQFVPGKMQGQFRDAAVHTQSGRVYLAVYNHAQVWAFDPVSREALAQVPAGRGPAALALSPDENVLAVVNRQDNSVTLVRVPQHEQIATVPVGEGPTAIAALPDGRFAVANTFGDSVSLVNPRDGTAFHITAPELSVPEGIAVSGDLIGVTGRGASALSLFTFSGSPSGSVALPAPPKDIVGLPGGFVVSTGTELLLIDAASRQIVQRVGSPATVLEVYEGATLAFEPDTGIATPYHAGLAIGAPWTVPPGMQRLVAAGGVYIALAPQAQSWQIWNEGGLTLRSVAADADPPMQAVESSPQTLQVREAEPVGQSATANDTVVQEIAVEPMPVEAPLPEQPALALEAPEEMQEQPEETPAPVALAEGDAEAPEIAGEVAPAGPRTGQVRKYPISTRSVGAPYGGRRPSAVPMRQLNHRTIADALVQPTEFGSEEAGFQPPDWTEPFRDIEFERMESAPDANVVELEGNVRLRLGDMYFGADRFSYDRAVGAIHGAGNIQIRQQESILTADEFTYAIPSGDTTLDIPAAPFTPVLTDQDLERKRLTLGTLYARNVYVDEPTRYMSAKEIEYNFGDDTGTMLHVHGQAGIYYYGADNLRILGPASFEGDDVWVTTCDHDPPHYRVRLSRARIEEGVAVGGCNARLQLGSVDTPFFLPKWRRSGGRDYPWTFDFDSGRRAALGPYLNVGQLFEVTPDVAIGPRIFITEKEGVGLGGDLEYDFMKSPAAWLYRTRGEMSGLYTTDERGYLHWYHRYEYDENLTLRMQAEHWSDRNFYKDFFYDTYRNRTSPRSFANVTYRQEDYIATATTQVSTHGWVEETERLPEATFHLLERPLMDRVYLSFDTITGYNDSHPYGDHGTRSVNLLRLSYGWDPLPALAITPYVELEGTWYSRQRDDSGSATRFSTLTGVTAQTRFHREFAGRWGFSALKHVVVPSITYSYRSESSLSLRETPQYDLLDSIYGRSRIESKLDNIIYGRDAETSEVWQVARLTLYQGNDLWNEVQKSHDYEIEIDIRPRPWVGFQLVAERHDVNEGFRYWYDELRYNANRLHERLFGRPFTNRMDRHLDSSFDDYNRLLAQVYYEEHAFNARLGFAYTETRGEVYNREILYGLGYEINDKWGIGFEHRYDFEDNKLRSQSYEIRRSLHCWETAIRVRDRESGFDVDLTFNIKAFPGTRLKL